MGKTIKIVTDSSCNLTTTEIEQFGLMVIPIRIRIGKETFKENSALNLSSIAYKINSEKSIPKVVSPSVDEFFKTYSLVYPRFNNILSIHLASGVSDIFTEAKNAQALLYDANINVVDSTLTEVGLKPLLLKVATLAMNQTPEHEIINTMQHAASRFTSFAIASQFRFVQTNTNYHKRSFTLPSISDQHNRYLFSSTQGNLYLIDKLPHTQVIDHFLKMMESLQKERPVYMRIQYALDRELAYSLADTLVTKLDIIVKSIDEMSVSSMCRFGTHAVTLGFTEQEDFFEEYLSSKAEPTN